MNDLLIKNALIDDRVFHIYIKDEKIAEISEQLDEKYNGVKTIDAKGLIAIPAGIDSHVHFDTPGFESREDFLHGSMSALAGGITTVIDMPCTSIPAVTSRENLQTKLDSIGKMAVCDFALWGGISAIQFDEDWKSNLDGLWMSGVIGFKSYLTSGMKSFPELNQKQFKELLEYANSKNYLLAFHAEDSVLINKRMKELFKKGRKDALSYYQSRKEPVESNAVSKIIRFMKSSPVHIVHLGSGDGLKFIKTAKKKGKNISVETCPHYLSFTYRDMLERGSRYKVAPTLKTKNDSNALIKGIIDGKIDYLASDHAPCSVSDKKTGSIWKDYSGMPGVQTLLPFAISELYLNNSISYKRLVEITSQNSSKRYGLYPNKGVLGIGSDADIVLFDPKGKVKITDESLFSKGKMTPFLNCTFKGKIVYTILRGKIVFASDVILARPGSGKFIKRND